MLCKTSGTVPGVRLGWQGAPPGQSHGTEALVTQDVIICPVLISQFCSRVTSTASPHAGARFWIQFARNGEFVIYVFHPISTLKHAPRS